MDQGLPPPFDSYLEVFVVIPGSSPRKDLVTGTFWSLLTEGPTRSLSSRGTRRPRVRGPVSD